VDHRIGRLQAPGLERPARRVPGDLRAVTHLQRPFLHAARLAFRHPVDHRKMEFTSELPEDLRQVLDDLPQTRRA